MEKKIKEDGKLLEALQQLYNEISRKKIKSYLKNQAVLVNNRIITQYDYSVKIGNIINIKKENKTHKKSSLKIIYEDKEFLVVEKPAGLLTIATEKEKQKTAYHITREFVKNRNYHENLFILHRLDKDTSGVLIFVKTESLKQVLQKNWNHLVKIREYYAVVHGKPKSVKNYICYLKENKNYHMSVSEKSLEGKKAITSFDVLKTTGKRSLLKIKIKTGRKNQIRVVLSHLGYPIIGDKKYGSSDQKEKRLYLHATKISFLHPITKKEYTFESKLPSSFWKEEK